MENKRLQNTEIQLTTKHTYQPFAKGTWWRTTVSMRIGEWQADLYFICEMMVDKQITRLVEIYS